MTNKHTKISVVGAGAVGSAASYALMQSGLCQELVLVDINKAKAEGEVMDLNHCADFISPMKIVSGDYEKTKDSDIVVITAGVAQKPGETRIQLVERNVAIFKSMIPEIVKYSPDSILLVVSNPVDILSYVTYKLSGFPKERVIGSGTLLDSSRMKYEISKRLDVSPKNIETYIMGEHGDTEFSAWSLTKVNGIDIENYAELVGVDIDKEKDEIEHNVKNAAYEVINRKGATDFAIGMSITRICKAIVNDERAILPVSSLVENYYGIDEIYLGIPAIVGGSGLIKNLKVDLNDEEVKSLQNSARALKEVLGEQENKMAS